ncbi:MAG: glycoside hydrolase [Oscillospiraceae bacterium]|nr:glycoside hydrolase [Oscillospiraceae bacterium]
MQVTQIKTIYQDGEYLAFPNVAWLKEDVPACFFRHAKDRRKEDGKVTHIDPTAKIAYVVSDDGGNSFSSDLKVILDDEMSEQDPCVTVLSDGRIIVSLFRWDFVEEGKGAEKWGKALFERYGRSIEGKYDTFNIGFSVIISDDNGQTWKHHPVIEPDGYIPGSAVRGNIVELPDKTLLMPFYGAKYEGALASCGLVCSKNRGETWDFLSETACDKNINFLEPFLFRTDSGRLISLFRTQSDFLKPNVDFSSTYLNLHICVSDDDGHTFGPVREISSIYASNPFHALRLKSGKVLVSYGYRREPYGIRAKLCDGELSDLETADEIIVRADAPNGDLGYTGAMELSDGSALVVYYISNQDGQRIIEGAVLKE